MNREPENAASGITQLTRSLGLMTNTSSGPPAIPDRPSDGHKGTFGRVLLVVGSRGMSGAAILAGLGALRGGAGLVSVASPIGIQPIVAGHEPGYLTIGLAEGDDGRLIARAAAELESACTTADAIGIGPGLRNTSEVEAIVRQINSSATCPLILDADALNVLAPAFKDGSFRNQAAGPRILTPHPGEFARMTGLPRNGIQQDRENLSRRFATEHGVVLVLKGHETITTDGTFFARNETGNSGMATGGSGDVLTGLVTALCAQKMKPVEAARLGVWLHGRAGDLGAAELSEHGLIASDLPRFLGEAWASLS